MGTFSESENVSTLKYDFEHRLCAQSQDLQIFKKFYMSQMNPKEFVHNTHTQFNYLTLPVCLFNPSNSFVNRPSNALNQGSIEIRWSVPLNNLYNMHDENV